LGLTVIFRLPPTASRKLLRSDARMCCIDHMPQRTLTFLTPSFATPLHRPLLAWLVKAGFPSPADDYLEGWIDLTRE
jgi:hypothetical protein